MKKLLLIAVVLMLTGCVAYPVYDEGYNYPYYDPYPYYYTGPEVNVIVPFYSGYQYHSHAYHGAGRGIHGGSRGISGGGYGGRRR